MLVVLPLALGIALIILMKVRYDNHAGERRLIEHEHGNGLEKEDRWSREGFTDEERKSWESLEFGLSRAVLYRDRGMSPQDAKLEDSREKSRRDWQLPYLGHDGFSPEQVQRWQQAGYSAGDARTLSSYTGDYDTPPPKQM
jgi:hypothetical protein